MRLPLAVLTVALAPLVVACDAAEPAVGTAEPAPTYESGYVVEIDPSDFVAVVDNPYFPLAPGTRWRLEGETDEGHEVDVITVTDRTRDVMGVTTTVVKDVVSMNGEIAEKTFDWYAQDVDGDVWYFGEKTAEYEYGKRIDTDGSWEAGSDGALPGIIMHADPRVTDSHRQEYYVGEAQDMYWVVEVGTAKRVPLGHFEDVVHTLEWTPIEPNVVGEKFYAPGVGLIWERSLAGGHERFELVEMTPP